MNRPQYLLLKDVEGLGRSGDLVTAKPGFINNYLEPQAKAVRADKRTIRMQARLQEERAKQAEIDRKISLEVAEKVKELVIEHRVKVDTEGHMYGSVSTADISSLLADQGIELNKKHIRIQQPIKDTGIHMVTLKLKEGVDAILKLKVLSESGEMIERKAKKKAQEAPEEAEAEAKISEEVQNETNEESE